MQAGNDRDFVTSRPSHPCYTSCETRHRKTREPRRQLARIDLNIHKVKPGLNDRLANDASSTQEPQVNKHPCARGDLEPTKMRPSTPCLEATSWLSLARHKYPSMNLDQPAIDLALHCGAGPSRQQDSSPGPWTPGDATGGAGPLHAPLGGGPR
ncbi:unnamed protein product [Pleuronectes platessa]|uniref:Uncharacterized protein n=1 Tax=Pleuronectes platessa TaxID=8262 RepID=A0A9N7YF22_PLEPL|nr:unnamed protein product [Pleuronectes platessa]